MAHSPNQIALSKKSRKGAAADPERAALRQSVRTEDSLKAAQVAASAAQDRKADDVVVVDLRELSSYTDFLVICSGTSDRMLDAVSEGVEKAMKDQGHRTVGSEGGKGGRWLLLDFGDVVVHVFHQDERGHYDLEGLWADAPRIELK
jgi:ribosome-associated protein